MLSIAPETLALGNKLHILGRELDEITTLQALAHKYFLDQLFSGLSKEIQSLYDKREEEYLQLLETRKRNTHYEVTVADAAGALDVSENTIRKWDVEGCPDDPNYPGRFSSPIFYQWAITYRSKKRFASEAKKRAVLMNSM